MIGARSASVLVVLLAACWPAARLVRPDMIFEVSDERGVPVDARIVVLEVSDPGLVVGDRDERRTERGVGRFSSKRSAAVESCAPHGIGHYYATWCVAAKGYAPQFGHTKYVEDTERIRVTLALRGDGEEDACPTQSSLLLERALAGRPPAGAK